jgi:CHRD domain
MRLRVAIAVLALLVVASVGSLQASAGGGRVFMAMLDGYQEAPATLSVPGTGTFRADLAVTGESLSYRLSYSDLTGPALFAHIHLGQPAIAGGVIAFLCDSTENALPGVPDCPGAGGTVTGTIEPDDVIGPAGQGIASGEFDELVAALRAGAAYANVYTVLFQPGEIRGQIR